MVEATGNENVVTRLIDCINDRRIEVMDELFHDDAVMHWPQSGELVRGAENRRGIYNAFPQLPTITPRRMLSGGNLVVAEALLERGLRGARMAGPVG
ncbi:nuclear transport factor 2 family protein [Pseudarthrobacter sp. AB1]|uniref:nuclear transport factor 2 family protein n=1 Tax=Pseudarthrobacter sp. AB1 TaxID=2138309 RepID=UPI002815FC58|nr:nuclear transport factor 2 family protein [Pseudarthrobacter sp. AB1]